MPKSLEWVFLLNLLFCLIQALQHSIHIYRIQLKVCAVYLVLNILNQLLDLCNSKRIQILEKAFPALGLHQHLGVQFTKCILFSPVDLCNPLCIIHCLCNTSQLSILFLDGRSLLLKGSVVFQHLILELSLILQILLVKHCLSLGSIILVQVELTVIQLSLCSSNSL